MSKEIQALVIRMADAIDSIGFDTMTGLEAVEAIAIALREVASDVRPVPNGIDWVTAFPATPGAWPPASFRDPNDALEYVRAHQSSGAIIASALSPVAREALRA